MFLAVVKINKITMAKGTRRKSVFASIRDFVQQVGIASMTIDVKSVANFDTVNIFVEGKAHKITTVLRTLETDWELIHNQQIIWHLSTRTNNPKLNE